MLTQISNDLIHHFLGKSDVNALLKSQTVRLLYENLHSEYKNSKIKLTMNTMNYPKSDFIAKSIKTKLESRKNVMTLNWTTTGKSRVRNTLHIYHDSNDIDHPNTKLLVEAISYITSFSDKNRKITIHLCMLPDKKILKKNFSAFNKSKCKFRLNRFNDIESEICIFRKEECIKVIFHEILMVCVVVL